MQSTSGCGVFTSREDVWSVFFVVQPVQGSVDELSNVQILCENLCNSLSELRGRPTCPSLIKYTWFHFPLFCTCKIECFLSCTCVEVAICTMQAFWYMKLLHDPVWAVNHGNLLQFLIQRLSAVPLEAWYSCVSLGFNFQSVLIEDSSKYWSIRLWQAENLESNFPLQTTLWRFRLKNALSLLSVRYMSYVGFCFNLLHLYAGFSN